MEFLKPFLFVALCTICTGCLYLFGVPPQELALTACACVGMWAGAICFYIQYRMDLKLANETASMARRYAEELAYRQKVESGLIPTTQPRA